MQRIAVSIQVVIAIIKIIGIINSEIIYVINSEISNCY